MERRERTDLAALGLVGKPAPARAEDAVLGAEEVLHGGAAEADQDVRVRQLDLALHERLADGDLLRGGVAVAGRAPGHEIGDIDMAAVETDRRQHPVEKLAERPMKGFPTRSSSAPGISPTSITRPSGFPSAKTRFLALVLKAQPSKAASRASSSARLCAPFARSRASAAASSGDAVVARLDRGGTGAGRASGSGRRRGPGSPRLCGGKGGAGTARPSSAKRSWGVSSSAQSTPAPTWKSSSERRSRGSGRSGMRAAPATKC
jgi:hypothetical protein